MALIKIYKKYLTITAIAWAVCLVLFVAAYLILLRPQTNHKRSLGRTLTEKEQLYEFAQLAAQEQTQIRLNEQIERLRERVKDFVVDAEDAVNLTFDIGQIANEKKVTSFSVEPKDKPAAFATPVPDSNCVEESYIEISFTTGFNQFAAFVNALERHRPVLFVHQFVIARSKKDDSVYKATLAVRALVMKQQDTETADISSEQVYSANK
ncbi:MAG: hypothetical protein ACYSWW_08055 [Planctomycetota bacterium]|jgi:hypothetical protein